MLAGQLADHRGVEVEHPVPPSGLRGGETGVHLPGVEDHQLPGRYHDPAAGQLQPLRALLDDADGKLLVTVPVEGEALETGGQQLHLRTADRGPQPRMLAFRTTHQRMIAERHSRAYGSAHSSGSTARPFMGRVACSATVRLSARVDGVRQAGRALPQHQLMTAGCHAPLTLSPA